MKHDRHRRQAHQLAADQAPRRVRRTTATATQSSPRTRRSRPAAPWRRSPQARAGGRNRSCWREAARRTPMRCGTATQRQARRRSVDKTSARPQPKQDRKTALASRPIRLPDFIPPQLCEPVERPPGGAAGSMRSSSTATACSFASKTARRRSGPAKGSTGRTKFAAIAKRPQRCRTASSTARSWRSTRTAPRISPRYRRRCPKARPDDLIFFAFDLLLTAARICARGRSSSARTRLQAASRESRRQAHAIRYRRAFRDRRRRGAALGLPAVARRDRLETARCALPIRPQRQLDQSEMPAGQRSSSAAGPTTAAKFRSLLVGVHRGDHFVYVGRVGTGYRRGEGQDACCRD